MKLIRWVASTLLLATLSCAASSAPPLHDYVKQSDASYKVNWDEKETELSDGVTLREIRFVSQTWQGIPWSHRLSVLKPKEMKEDPVGLLFITGDYRAGQAAPFAKLAAAAKQPVFILWDIPNQPLFNNLEEDALIALTFAKVMETGDMTWPLLFPMTKGAIRAMDTAQELAKRDWKTTVSKFVVTGASKRGWTTWLTAATGDERVIGIAPMVYDNLNLVPQMRHQIESRGKYSEQIGDYTERGLQALLGTEAGLKLAAAVDPYTFRDEIKIPKLILNGTNDRYWTLDAANFYFADLRGPKNLLYVPNAGHGLQDLGRVTGGLLAFWMARSAGENLPQTKWTYNLEGDEKERLRLTVWPVGTPKAVRVWKSASDTKDFREVKWASSPIEKSDNRYSVTLDIPTKGYAAMFGEVEYERDGVTYNLSTQIQIVGDDGKPEESE